MREVFRHRPGDTGYIALFEEGEASMQSSHKLFLQGQRLLSKQTWNTEKVCALTRQLFPDPGKPLFACLPAGGIFVTMFAGAIRPAMLNRMPFPKTA